MTHRYRAGPRPERSTARGHELGARTSFTRSTIKCNGIALAIEELLTRGWNRVTIVTDHGWLLLPGGLPKNEDLPVRGDRDQEGRCARIKDGALFVGPDSRRGTGITMSVLR